MKRLKLILLLLLIGVVVLYSVGNTLHYYFYTDDYVFLYYLRNNLNFGWPYSSVLSIFRPIYQIFGINPLPYFAMAIISYFFASLSVFYFTKILIKNKLIATLSSLVFATGYIGLDQFSMIAVSIINNLNVINVCITLSLLVRFVETRKNKYYFLTFFMFWFSLALFPYRAYPLVLLLPTIEIIRTFKFNTLLNILRQISFLIIRFIPFFIVGVSRGIFSYGTHGTGHVDKLNLINPQSKIYTLFYFDFFKELFAVFGKFIFVEPLLNLMNLTPTQNLYFVVGLSCSLITILIFAVLLIERRKLNAKNLFILLILLIESYVGNMFLNVDFDANGPVNRYLTISFAFFAPFIIFLLYLIFEKIERIKFLEKRKLLVITTMLIIFCLSSLSRKYIDLAIGDRSQPSRKFFKELKAYIPSLSDSNYNVFYFDRASYYPVSSRFDHVLLSAAMGNSVNIALPYYVSVNSVKIVDNYDDFIRLILYPPKGRNVNYYSFYNDENGLHNTTSQVFDLLNKGRISVISSEKVTYGKNKNFPSSVVDIENISSLSPMKITLDLVVSPLGFQAFKFPYSAGGGLSNEVPSKVDKSKIFEYLISRENYYKTASIDVESIHVGKKNPASLMIDDDPGTYWISDQSRWEEHVKPWVKIDLASEKNINRIILKQIPGREIDSFDLSVSVDGVHWLKIKNRKLTTPYQDKNFAIIEFDEVNARYVKLAINSLSVGPGPGLAEFEVIDSSFTNVNFESAMRIKDFPFELIRDFDELYETYRYLSGNAKLNIGILTNKDDPSLEASTVFELPIYLDGFSHRYEFVIPQQGTQLKKINIKSSFPAELLIQNIIIENQSSAVIKDQVRKKCQEFMGVPEWKNPFDCKQVWEYNKPL